MVCRILAEARSDNVIAELIGQVTNLRSVQLKALGDRIKEPLGILRETDPSLKLAVGARANGVSMAY
jgi:hypothetical protein